MNNPTRVDHPPDRRIIIDFQHQNRFCGENRMQVDTMKGRLVGILQYIGRLFLLSIKFLCTTFIPINIDQYVLLVVRTRDLEY
ncbi:uncharacterized protein CANTADRAFT_279278 [Suhomyces tanzawaensis NRRL Y-17324]|uniref:Uncharacterized protein n=1 Tax=Suhomyces tanzawaensis NRRL Y-17324 TaxID=984487 RepID=A0A1E4SDW3_9ASCO|nr:uncharacterized protein CANTADRAFT_279278 [Suhomyces tanzawaensis NRRL Y-17324]ODV77710.1 hypothetical protein CANTADRAFT_279278 [Suhomyces tanzawaensis NRRL Y-17324]